MEGRVTKPTRMVHTIRDDTQWTGLAAWYGKLGTSVWAHYGMAKKLL